MAETNKILAILDNYLHDNPDEIAKEIAAEFRRRRIEKNLTREQVAEKSGVAVSRHCYGFRVYFRNPSYLLPTEV